MSRSVSLGNSSIGGSPLSRHQTEGKKPSEHSGPRLAVAVEGATTPLSALTSNYSGLNTELKPASRRSRSVIALPIIPNVRNRWYHDLLAFQAGLLGLDELPEEAGDNRVSQCEGLFHAGLKQLAEAKRAEAVKCCRERWLRKPKDFLSISGAAPSSLSSTTPNGCPGFPWSSRTGLSTRSIPIV